VKELATVTQALAAARSEVRSAYAERDAALHRALQWPRSPRGNLGCPEAEAEVRSVATVAVAAEATKESLVHARVRDSEAKGALPVAEEEVCRQGANTEVVRVQVTKLEAFALDLDEAAPSLLPVPGGGSGEKE
ncbi:unnamed protein product, partial [Discosporangium mesarthrocarpum]